MNILLTGSSGFLGNSLLPKLTQFEVTAIGRQQCAPDIASYYCKELSDSEDYSDCLANIDVVIHCAARAHIMKDDHVDALAEYRKVNTQGTLNLAAQAAASGAKRFVFISSVKVHGEATASLAPFTEQVEKVPVDPYGLSKYEAELGLRSISEDSNMEVVIIRPPLIYGPEVKANFLSLMKIADTGIPLPFGAINNKRSMVYVCNLVDFIVTCIEHPAAANQTFLISDGKDLSLTELLTIMRAGFYRSTRLFAIPVVLFRILGKIMGKTNVVNRLVDDLQIDSSKASSLLEWFPPFTIEQGIKATVTAYSEGEK